ncbi:hypothetical protein PAXINDRAFT_172954 [Paxillus involutus ATCC 200175]|uniref:Uncharacterized protein n=1 Tax=Paxillus involutus ATCC 200175 TaxID=664439 RepID=A0A0C9SYU3_PAXIN|nr:hypothetical protein PAXINDRAFT_172954 [Paxillus involutus ATCC 200175]
MDVQIDPALHCGAIVMCVLRPEVLTGVLSPCSDPSRLGQVEERSHNFVQRIDPEHLLVRAIPASWFTRPPAPVPSVDALVHGEISMISDVMNRINPVPQEPALAWCRYIPCAYPSDQCLPHMQERGETVLCW